MSSLLRISTGTLILAFWAVLAGCGQSSSKDDSTAKSAKKEVVLSDLKVLVVDDPDIGPVIARQWAARSGGKLEIVNESSTDLASQEFSIDQSVDVVIYPSRLLGDLVTAKRFEEVPNSVWDDEDQLNKKELLRHSRTTNVRWASRTWAVPLGSPLFVMLYRTDVLERLGESVPQTWADFDRIAGKLAAKDKFENANGQPLPTQIGLPLADYWRAQMLLLRSAAYVRARGRTSTIFERGSGKPMIANAAYVKALEGLQAVCANNYDELKQQTPKQTFLDLLSGKTAIAITWPSASFQPETDSELSDLIAIANVPGSSKLFDSAKGTWSERDSDTIKNVPLIGFSGLVASITVNSSNIGSARELLKWLPSKSISNSVLPKSEQTGPFRASHLGNPAKWTGGLVSPEAGEEYATVIRAANENTVIVVFPRIPGQAKFIAVLDRAVEDVLSMKESATAALTNAAGQFEQLLNEFPKSQLRIWLKSSKEF